MGDFKKNIYLHWKQWQYNAQVSSVTASVVAFPTVEILKNIH